MMMKNKTLLYTCVLLVILFFACTKDDKRFFDQSPQERTAALTKQYQDALTAAPYGWMAYLYPDTVRAFTFHFKFMGTARVAMLSQFSGNLEGVPVESDYGIRNVRTPALIFNTYNLLHLLSNPVPEVAGGEKGKGYYSDFEFDFQTMNGDSILLSGTFNKSKLLLVKTTQQQYNNLTNGAFTEGVEAFRDYFGQGRFFSVEEPALTSILIDTTFRQVSFMQAQTGGGATTRGITFAYTFDGLLLKSPFATNGTDWQLLRYKMQNGLVSGLELVAGNGQVLPLKETDTPVVPLADINQLVGYERMYTSFTFDIDQINPVLWSDDFLEVFDQYRKNMNGYNSSYRAGMVTLFFDRENKMIMRTETNNPSANAYYLADYEFNLSFSGDTLQISYVGPFANSSELYGFSNARGFENPVRPLISYFNNQRFILSWGAGVPNRGMVRLVKATNSASYVLGALGKAGS